MFYKIRYYENFGDNQEGVQTTFVDDETLEEMESSNACEIVKTQELSYDEYRNEMKQFGIKLPSIEEIVNSDNFKEQAFEIYLKEFNTDPDRVEQEPVCFNEFCDCEMQDEDIVLLYKTKIVQQSIDYSL